MDTNQTARPRKHREAGILLCYCPLLRVLHRYHNEQYSSGFKQRVLGVNQVARARYWACSPDLSINHWNPEPRVLAVVRPAHAADYAH